VLTLFNETAYNQTGSDSLDEYTRQDASLKLLNVYNITGDYDETGKTNYD
jgi:hypothetical protein